MGKGPYEVLGALAIHKVRRARMEAVQKHGELKPGPERWSRLLAEEWQEVEDELRTLSSLRSGMLWGEDGHQAKMRAMEELAQLAQLAIGIIELIQGGNINEQQD